MVYSKEQQPINRLINKKILDNLLRNRPMYTLNIQSYNSIRDVKQKVFDALHIPIERQKLLLIGKPLADDKKISDYPIKEGSKLHLIIKKEDSSKSTRLGRMMFLYLSQYYSEADSKRILDEFMKNFKVSISNLSLDDLERIATSYLKEEKKND